jgi:hypothetical protein
MDGHICFGYRMKSKQFAVGSIEQRVLYWTSQIHDVQLSAAIVDQFSGVMF